MNRLRTRNLVDNFPSAQPKYVTVDTMETNTGIRITITGFGDYSTPIGTGLNQLLSSFSQQTGISSPWSPDNAQQHPTAGTWPFVSGATITHASPELLTPPLPLDTHTIMENPHALAGPASSLVRNTKLPPPT